MSALVESPTMAQTLAREPAARSLTLPAGSRTAAAPLGEQLVRDQLITSDELNTALTRQKGMGLRLGESLIKLGFAHEDQILPYVQQHLRIPATRLRDGIVDPLAVRLIPRSKADALKVLALFKVRDTLCVAMSEPQNLHHIDEIEKATGLRVRPVFAFRTSIERMIQRTYQEGFQVDAVTADVSESELTISDDIEQMDVGSLDSLVEGSPVINLVNYLILNAVRRKASDIHIEPSRAYSVVRFRVDGQLQEVLRPRRDIHPAVVSRIKVMAKMDIAEHRLPQDGRIQVVMEGREVDLRVSTMPTVLGEKAVLRVLDRSRLTFDLAALGIPPDTLDQFKQMLGKPYGLLLVTGPTGSGKTTTLYSALELVKSVHRNIVTVEDPVEYQIGLINQVQVNDATGFSFANSLRAILRQDPDVIMVGEIRDTETARVAVQAALTGHLVLSTLHTNDSPGAITRLLDMGVASYQLAAALVGVVAQRLVRSICPACRAPYYPPEELLREIHFQGDLRQAFARGQGCPSCNETGFKGRTGVYELMSCNNELRALIMREPDIDAFRNWHRTSGGRSLLEEGIRVAAQGKSSLDEVMRAAFFE
jgi:type IV pilus assembly protein PilB